MVLGIKKKVQPVQREPVEEPDEIEEADSEDTYEEEVEEEQPDDIPIEQVNEVIRKAQEQMRRTKNLRTQPEEESNELTEEQEAIVSHEKRLQALEAFVFRLKSV